jgi:hypothetical protein
MMATGLGSFHAASCSTVQVAGEISEGKEHRSALYEILFEQLEFDE